MNVSAYKARRAVLRAEELSRGRNLCVSCLQPPYGCYCESLKPFDPRIEFIVLIHPIEARRRIATGRMSHLSLQNSTLIRGHDFTDSAAVQRIISDPDVVSATLYPGPSSTDISALEPSERAALFPREKRLAIFVLDGTWWTARKMIRSPNLARLPRICFSPPGPSRFRVRQQPSPECWSTIEAIHHTIELLGESRGFSVASREHDALLDVFDVMVERQLAHVNGSQRSRHRSPKRA